MERTSEVLQPGQRHHPARSAPSSFGLAHPDIHRQRQGVPFRFPNESKMRDQFSSALYRTRLCWQGKLLHSLEVFRPCQWPRVPALQPPPSRLRLRWRAIRQLPVWRNSRCVGRGGFFFFGFMAEHRKQQSVAKFIMSHHRFSSFLFPLL